LIILGTNTSNFTATNELFLDNPQITLWKFEVVYTFTSETSSSALNFIINQPPYNGSCSINPLNGTTSTLFKVSCPDWFDQDGIKDYSLYSIYIYISFTSLCHENHIVILAWTTDSSQQIMIAFSSVSDFQIRLPAGDAQTSLLNIVIHIRDILDCVTEVNISSVSVIPDSTGITDLINTLQNSPNEITNNPIVRLLASQNQNIVGQIITSLSQQFNQINNESVNKAASSIDIRSLFYRR